MIGDLQEGWGRRQADELGVEQADALRSSQSFSLFPDEVNTLEERAQAGDMRRIVVAVGVEAALREDCGDTGTSFVRRDGQLALARNAVLRCVCG